MNGLFSVEGLTSQMHGWDQVCDCWEGSSNGSVHTPHGWEGLSHGSVHTLNGWEGLSHVSVHTPNGWEGLSHGSVNTPNGCEGSFNGSVHNLMAGRVRLMARQWQIQHRA